MLYPLSYGGSSTSVDRDARPEISGRRGPILIAAPAN